ncbi:MAG: nitronate monooxygenase [Alphaproteobacteria bacterium]|nr:MAG: nitronate monooxygenase [Alphaproteobacteria bacterium]
MAIATALTRLLSITHPIILAPMGGIAGGRLAAAVSQAGGFGIIGGGYGNPKAGYGGKAWMEEQLRAAGNAQIGVGYITWSLALFPELFDQAMERSPKAFFLSFGDEKPFATRVKATGVTLICQIQDIDGAKRALDAGADIIVAQGTEAGGHGKSGRTTLTLTPAVVDIAGAVPVVAAGGLSDGRGLAAALMLGASGILVGTRFWATPEALGSDAAKRLLTEARSDDTLRTRVFDIVRGLDWPEGYSGRAIANDFSRNWHGHESELERNLVREAEAYWTAARAGDTSKSVVFAGEGLDLIHDIKPAGDIVRMVAAEAERLLKTRAGADLN